MTDERTGIPPVGPRLVEPAALVILAVAALAAAALLTLGPVGGAWGIMLAVVIAFAVIHIGCLAAGCRAGPRG